MDRGAVEVLVMAAAMVGVWAGAAVPEEDLGQPLVWAAGMEEASVGGLLTPRGEPDTPRPTVPTP
jgi:hypothetical protein